jgi:hypothetical protein
MEPEHATNNTNGAAFMARAGYQRLPSKLSADDRLDELLGLGVGIAVALSEGLRRSDAVADRRFALAADALLDVLHEAMEIVDRKNGSPNPGRVVEPSDN